MFVIFFAAAFLLEESAAVLIPLGIVAGGLAGLIRMSQGGHFLSDVLFAGLAMAITVVVIFRVFQALGRSAQLPIEAQVAT